MPPKKNPLFSGLSWAKRGWVRSIENAEDIIVI